MQPLKEVDDVLKELAEVKAVCQQLSQHAGRQASKVYEKVPSRPERPKDEMEWRAKYHALITEQARLMNKCSNFTGLAQRTDKLTAVLKRFKQDLARELGIPNQVNA